MTGRSMLIMMAFINISLPITSVWVYLHLINCIFDSAGKIFFQNEDAQSPVIEEINDVWIGLYTKVPWVISLCASEVAYFLFTKHYSDLQTLVEISFQETVSNCFKILFNLQIIYNTGTSVKKLARFS